MTLRDMMEIYQLNNNKDIFSDFVLNSIVNRQALIDYLVMEYGDMETVEDFSETFHQAILTFFLVHKWNIDKLAESLEFEYNPIYNSDHYSHETWARDESIATDIKEDEDWTEKGHTDEQDVNLVSAFNDLESRLDSLIDTEKNRDVIKIDYQKEGTDDKTTDKDEVQDEDYTGDIHKWGHDPSKSYQELIEEEREQAQFNIYKWIGKHFSLELLLGIW